MKVIFTKQLKTIQSQGGLPNVADEEPELPLSEALLIALRLCAILAIACVWGLYWF